MQTIPVSSLPLGDVINEIAKAFHTESTEKFDEYSLQLPDCVGQGSIKGINFEGGLGIIQYNCTFEEDTEIQFIVNSVHPLKFIYVIEGTLHHRFEGEKTIHIVHKFQNTIVASSDNHGHILNFKKGVKTSIFSLEINREKFISKSHFFREDVDPEIKKIFQDHKAEIPFYYEGDYSLKMADIFKKIEDFNERDFLYKFFMQSVAYRTLVYQISQFLDDRRDENHRSVLRRSEIEKIVDAANYIKNNLVTYRSLPCLTTLTGLNSSKLQEGFKHLFNKTVNQYVYNMRIELAKELLMNTDDSISEIVYKVGLSSKSYFSKIFKNEYGVQPSSFRKTKKQ